MPISRAERAPMAMPSGVMRRGPEWSRFRERAAQLAFFAGVLLLWQAAAEWGPWVSYLFPAPSQVAAHLWKGLVTGSYLRGSLVTVLRLVVGYSVSAVLGVALGAGIHRVTLLRITVGKVVLGLQALPSVCWLPLALVWFGLSERAIGFVVVMGSLLSVTIATEQGVRNVPPIYVRAARTMGARGVKLYTRVVLPAALPAIVTGMKLGWTFAWRSLLAAELIYVSGGLGQLLIMGRELNDMAEMMAVMVVIIFIGLVNDRLVFGKVERRVRERWGYDRP